jgi:glycosyltransferase involved in cell wall biosynthesis
VRYLRDNRSFYDKVIFFTYLYYPTLWGVREVQDKAILIPEAHDELPFRFDMVADLLARVPLILVNTEAERDLVIGRVPHRTDAVRLAGLGVDVPAPAATRVRSDPPFLLCSGRLSRAKGVGRLLDDIAELSRTPGLDRVRLILTGSLEGGISIPASPLIEFRGSVADEERRDLLRRATALVNLSDKESLSLVVLEAMAMRTPVIVNGRSPVFKRYADENPTVFAVEDRADFCRAVQRIVATDWTTPTSAAALDAAREWVSTRYGWPRVLGVYREALGLTTPLAQQGAVRSR